MQSKWKVCELVQLAAGLYRAAPAASEQPLLHGPAERLSALSCTRALERVHATTSTRRGRGKTVKPVFIENRTASSMELIASAQAELSHADGEYIVSPLTSVPGHALRGGM